MHPQSAAHRLLGNTLTPFLYPCLDGSLPACSRYVRNATRLRRPLRRQPASYRSHTTLQTSHEHSQEGPEASKIDVNQFDHLNPTPLDYSSQIFADACTLSVGAGSGGHGCISFLREKYIANGPPNGGDGGSGGSIYIQAVKGETSLHKLARRGILKAGRGKNGQGSLKGGARGEDILITVPVGTVVREISRHDPVVDEEAHGRLSKGYGRDLRDDHDDHTPPTAAADQTPKWRRDRWLIYPGALPRAFTTADFPALPRPRRSQLTALQPPAPLRLDLEAPMSAPLLLAAGAMGGLGNPHFVTKSIPRPKFATKGDDGMRLTLHLELKLLADVGLVGAPNAGKSTLLRALTRSRTRVGDWAFTTLSPNIGTVVLDPHTGRPALDSRRTTRGASGEPRANFTIADIPGLIEDAHLDHGLGLGFLKHVERAAMLAFVVDLGAGDAVRAVKALWRELGEYEKLREGEVGAERERLVAGSEAGAEASSSPSRGPFEGSVFHGADAEALLEGTAGGAGGGGGMRAGGVSGAEAGREQAPLALPAISSKPWLVIATKADLPDTQENFVALQRYLRQVQEGDEEHPSQKPNAWRKSLYSVPVSAINKEGVASLPEIIVRLLDD